jgi:hypothetical protein
MESLSVVNAHLQEKLLTARKGLRVFESFLSARIKKDVQQRQKAFHSSDINLFYPVRHFEIFTLGILVSQIILSSFGI